MKTQTKIITYLIAILMLLQPLMVTVAYATEGGEPNIEVVEEIGVETITISDTNLYEALKKEFGKRGFNAVYVDEHTIKVNKADLDSIKVLELDDCKISDLSGLDKFTKLEELSLSSNNLTSDSGLEILTEFANLKELDISENKIEDVSKISSLLNKEGLVIDIHQDFEMVEFVNKIRQPETTEEGKDIFFNDKRDTINLPQILRVDEYPNMDIKITSFVVDGEELIDDADISKYVEIKDIEEDGKTRKVIRILNRDKLRYVIGLELEGDKPNNGTKCLIKAFLIDADTQTGIAFKDKNLYNVIKEKYEYAKTDVTKRPDFVNKYENYDEWGRDYKFQGEDWVFDNKSLVIVANKKELETIETLTVSDIAISDLTGVEKFLGLSSLTFSNTTNIIDTTKINSLDENKEFAVIGNEKTGEEGLVQKFNKYKDRIKTLKDDYDAKQSQIDTLKKEIINIEQGKESVNGETIYDKEYELDELKAEQQIIIGNINNLINSIDELNGYNNDVIKKLLAGYSVSLDIEQEKEILEELYKSNETELQYVDQNEQANALLQNKLVEFTNRINSAMTNLTVGQISELANNVEFIGTVLITETERDSEKAKYSINYIKSYIDEVSKNNIKDIIAKIEDLTECDEIKTTDSEGNDRELSAIKSDLKSALDVYTTKFKKDGGKRPNTMTDDAVVEACKNITHITEDEILFKVQGKIIEKIQKRLSELAIKKSESIINRVEKNMLDKTWKYDEIKAENNKYVQELYVAYSDLQNILVKLENGLDSDFAGIKDGTINEVDRLNIEQIVTKIQNATTEEIIAAVKYPDLIKVELIGNSINNVDNLATIETLEELNLSNDIIEEFDFSKFGNLKKLYLDDNSIYNVEIAEMPNIEVLDLSSNMITDINKINLSGMPKLYDFNLYANGIQDVEHLINSKNAYLESRGYKNLGEYWSAGNSDISVAAQIIDITVDIDNTGANITTIKLPKIFSQMQELETSDFKVDYQKVFPCLDVYPDGTRVKLDTREKNKQKEAIAYMYTSNFLEFFTCKIKYTVVDDEVAPTITNVAGVSTEWTNGDVTLTIEATDEGIGLHTTPYSFDNGATWNSFNTKTFAENTENIIIKVRDAKENIYTHEPISITNIDKTAPVINTPEVTIIDAESRKANVVINITENESGLKETKECKYFLSTSKDEQIGGEWTVYIPGTAFEIGENLEGTFYMFINTVSDNAGNVSKAIEPVEFTFVIPDKTNPTITGVSGNPENWTNEDVILEIKDAKDNVALDDEPYSFDGGNSWQESNTKTYTQNTEDIQILVRDAAGNTYRPEKVTISKIDKTAPVVNVNVETTEDGKAKITVTATDAESDLNAENEYKYNVSTSKDELTSEEWTEYKSGETFEIGENLDDGTYYITIKNVKDNANNEKVIAPVEVKLETKEQEEQKDPEPNKGTFEYLTLSGITKLIRAYIADDYSTLPESYKKDIAGEDGKFELTEITRAIRLFLDL